MGRKPQRPLALLGLKSCGSGGAAARGAGAVPPQNVTQFGARLSPDAQRRMHRRRLCRPSTGAAVRPADAALERGGAEGGIDDLLQSGVVLVSVGTLDSKGCDAVVRFSLKIGCACRL